MSPTKTAGAQYWALAIEPLTKDRHTVAIQTVERITAIDLAMFK